MKLTMDFESRATIDIKKCGGYVYAEHPDTQVICLAVKPDDEPTMIWVPDWVQGILDTVDHDLPMTNTAGLRYLVQEAEVCEAHNAGGFERPMWANRMDGFPDIPISKWDDTAARAAMCALPRALDGATKAVGVKQEKDAEGYKLMLKMCRPRALRKKERDTLAAELGMTEEEVKSEAKAILSALKCDPRAPEKLRPDYHRFFAWHESADDLVRLCRYCIQDVEAEYALSQELPELPKGERKIWELDQVINDRGVLCDLVSVEHAEAIIEAHEEKLLDELRGLTGLSSAKAVAALKGWLEDNDCGVDDLTKQSVGDALKGDLSPEARRVLEIRQSLGKSSTAKLAAFKAYACKDGRLRGMMLYHGAATGRWTGKGPQPHNLPRGDEIIAHLQDQSIALYPVRDPGLLDAVMGDPLNVISSCLRGMLVAAPGHDLIACDYAAIEGRGLAWLAGEQHVLDAYAEGKDLYRVAAAGIYKIAYEQVDGGGKGKQRQVGKVAELACFAGDTLVLTDSGWKRIETVGPDDLLWDGVEFVAHDGVIPKGERAVINLRGIHVTPDHEFFVPYYGDWFTAEELQKDESLLVRALDVAALSRGPELRTPSSRDHSQVYDILNCGPRNRFFVLTERGPLIAHNCGYQGGWRAMLAFGADRMGMTEEEMKTAVKGWRESRPHTVRFWKGLEEAAFKCVSERVPTKFSAIRFKLHGKYLLMILPSGRPLWYYAPRIQTMTTPWGEEKRVVTAMTVDGVTKQWKRRPYHGGLLVENGTQAMCRDILALGLMRCEAAGYRPVLHVHDEIVAEVPKGFGSVEEMEQLMSIVPPWAEGMPIRAEGFRGHRYKK